MNLENNAVSAVLAIRAVLAMAKRECTAQELIDIRRQLLHEAQCIKTLADAARPVIRYTVQQT